MSFEDTQYYIFKVFSSIPKINFSFFIYPYTLKGNGMNLKLCINLLANEKPIQTKCFKICLVCSNLVKNPNAFQLMLHYLHIIGF